MWLPRLVFLTLIVASLKSGRIKTAAVVVNEDKCVKLPTFEEEIYEADPFWTFETTSGNLTIDLAHILRFEQCANQTEKKRQIRVDLVTIQLIIFYKIVCPNFLFLFLIHNSDVESDASDVI